VLRGRGDGLLLLRAVTWLVLCVVVSAIVARWLAARLESHQGLAYVAIYAIAACGSLGGFYWFAVAMSHLKDWRRGYRVRGLGANAWLYEELRGDGTVLQVRLLREVVGKGYPPPCRVIIQDRSADGSPVTIPTDVHQRIAECFGGHHGGHVQIEAL